MLKVYSDGNTNYELLLEDKIEELSKYTSELETKLDKIKGIIKNGCIMCQFQINRTCDTCVFTNFLQIIEGAEDEQL